VRGRRHAGRVGNEADLKWHARGIPIAGQNGVNLRGRAFSRRGSRRSGRSRRSRRRARRSGDSRTAWHGAWAWAWARAWGMCGESDCRHTPTLERLGGRALDAELLTVGHGQNKNNNKKALGCPRLMPRSRLAA
jgi:hypothetical protein